MLFLSQICQYSEYHRIFLAYILNYIRTIEAQFRRFKRHIVVSIEILFYKMDTILKVNTTFREAAKDE